MNRFHLGLFVLLFASCEVAVVPRQLDEPCAATCECDTGLACVADACAPIVRVICSPGVSSCVNGAISTCNDTGTSAVVTPCALGCLNGACFDTLCEPATSTCFGTQLATCNAWGLGWNVTGACD